MVRKRKVPRIIKDIAIPLRFGVANVVIGATGTATQPLLPIGTQNPLTTISTTMSRFAGPLTAVVGTGILVRQLRTLSPKQRKRKTRGGK